MIKRINISGGDAGGEAVEVKHSGGKIRKAAKPSSKLTMEIGVALLVASLITLCQPLGMIGCTIALVPFFYDAEVWRMF